jgi:hypothetical protein
MNALEERILECFPSGSYALSALLRLMDIVESDRVATAAVECRIQPRLLINPEFVSAHADTPEQLLMLVMHELHHVLLGHTTLFPTVTATDNFVFDCIINALISRMFPQQDHIRFLTNFYSDRKFPECLLRPPTGWNENMEARTPRAIRDLLPGKTGVRVAEVYLGLYSRTGVTYEEVYEVLPRYLPEDGLSGVPLLGGHAENGSTYGDFENRSPVLFDVVRSIVEEWPQPPDPIKGRSIGDIMRDYDVRLRSVPTNRAILRGLLRKIGEKRTGGMVREIRDDAVLLPTPIPCLDRRSIVMRSLGTKPLLYSGDSTLRRRTSAGNRVHVYVDVSGSMGSVISAVYGAVHDCREWVHPVIHLFSNDVSDADPNEIRKGIVRSTGGTDIACVAEHMATNSIRRACVVTDGWVGKAGGRHFNTLARAKLGVALVGDSVNSNDLSEVTDRTVTLSA